jgi:gliding motility-associated protein GldL
MAQSRKQKQIMNMVYGLGASIVIIGALFKIQHISIGPITGGLMLTIGLVVEAIVFAVGAFESVDDDLDWTRVYPELGQDGLASEREMSTEGMLSQKLDALLLEANIDSELMSSLGNSMKNFQGAAEGLSAASESISATSKYNEQMSLAAVQMESLNNLYQVQVQNASQQSELNMAVVQNTERLKDQMESLANNLSSLNGVYGGMLSAMSKN